jgi:hypothetical protein
VTRFLFFALLAIGFHAQAQNLVPNGGFEDYTELPTGLAQWNRVVGWNNITGDTACQTPDYFHTDADSTSGVQLPNTQYGDVELPEGFGAMGLLTYMTSSPDYREYISAQLTQPMVVGGIYELKFSATLGHNPFHGGASNNLGAALTVGPLDQRCISGASSVVPFAPVQEITSVAQDFDWEQQHHHRQLSHRLGNTNAGHRFHALRSRNVLRSLRRLLFHR